MNHTPNSSDNLFLRGHASLRNKQLKLPGKLILLVVLPLVLMFVLVLWFGQVQLQRDIATQADRTGSELARQIATLVADPLAANDTLSLNIILAQWAQSPLVAHTSLSVADSNRIVAQAGRKPSTDNLAPGQGEFIAAVHFQDELIGQLHLSLAKAPFAAPSADLVQRLVWSLVLLIIVAGLIAWRLGAGMRRVLAGLGNWYGDSGIAPPGLRRSDELGDLARRLAERRIIDLPPLPEPEPEPEPEVFDEVLLDDPQPAADQDRFAADELEPLADYQQDTDPESNIQVDETIIDAPAPPDTPPAPETDSADSDTAEQLNEQLDELPEPPIAVAPASTVLAIRLGNQHTLHRLPRPRLLGLLERYREQLEQASLACGGQLHTLQDGTSLVFFHPAPGDQFGNALCCGELMRVFGHELQIQIADTGIALHLQIALCHTPCADIAADDLAEQVSDCAQMLDRLQYSRNLLLMDAELAGDELVRDRAVVRRLASPAGIYCVERLREPYQQQLERRLNSLGH